MSERNVTSAANLYHSVIADIVTAVREPFLDEGVDENVLQELKTLWSNKLDASKTIEPPQPPPSAASDPQNPEARLY
uniref:Transcription initiation factor IIA subunit 1 n=1 Tax=Caligus rogercresseyi TaxID=217165 RepID=C1BQF1_CALRO|nr:Transcription initiation factor IIA subunit 1 [Caligus rogercresseyi]